MLYALRIKRLYKFETKKNFLVSFWHFALEIEIIVNHFSFFDTVTLQNIYICINHNKLVAYITVYSVVRNFIVWLLMKSIYVTIYQMYINLYVFMGY